MADNECGMSRRVDGLLHLYNWDGDDPYLKCVYCYQVTDALTGEVIRQGAPSTNE